MVKRNSFVLGSLPVLSDCQTKAPHDGHSKIGLFVASEEDDTSEGAGKIK